MDASQQAIREKIEAILAEVRPLLEAHGGGVSIVSVGNDGNVILKIEGACVGCAMSSLTFGLGIEKMIRERVPEVNGISYA